MQSTKTEMRSGMAQHTLNNIFRVAHNSEKLPAFDAEPFICHWMEESKKAKEARLVLEGEQIPTIFRLKQCYSTRQRAEKI